MCLAIGPMSDVQRGRIARAWWQIAQFPQRLFLFSSLFHSVVLIALLLTSSIRYQNAWLVYSTLIVYGIVGFAMLGALLQNLPRWYKQSAIDYIRYGMIYNMTFIGMILVELGLTVWSSALSLGLILLVFSWVSAVLALRWKSQWALSIKPFQKLFMLGVLYVFVLSLCSNLLEIVLNLNFVSDTWLIARDMLLPVLLMIGYSVSSNVQTQ